MQDARDKGRGVIEPKIVRGFIEQNINTTTSQDGLTQVLVDDPVALVDDPSASVGSPITIEKDMIHTATIDKAIGR